MTSLLAVLAYVLAIVIVCRFVGLNRRREEQILARTERAVEPRAMPRRSLLARKEPRPASSPSVQ